MPSHPHPPLAGGLAEQRALRLLLGRGWSLQARNWRCRWGELDLVVSKPGRLLLVEVKGRQRCGPDGWGVLAVDAGKRHRLARAWNCWLVDQPALQVWPVEWVCAVVPLPPMAGPVRWIRLDRGGRTLWG